MRSGVQKRGQYLQLDDVLVWGMLKANDYIRYVEERAVGEIVACFTETFMPQSNFFNI